VGFDCFLPRFFFFASPFFLICLSPERFTSHSSIALLLFSFPVSSLDRLFSLPEFDLRDGLSFTCASCRFICCPRVLLVPPSVYIPFFSFFRGRFSLVSLLKTTFFMCILACARPLFFAPLSFDPCLFRTPRDFCRAQPDRPVPSGGTAYLFLSLLGHLLFRSFFLRTVFSLVPLFFFSIGPTISSPFFFFAVFAYWWIWSRLPFFNHVPSELAVCSSDSSLLFLWFCI